MSNDCDPSGTADSQKPEEIVVHINKLAFLRTCGAGTIVFVNYHPWHRFTTDDALDLRFVAANLVCSGVAEPSEVVAALKVSRATLHRDRLRLEEGGLPAMVAGTARGPKGPTKVTRNLRAEARKLRRQGLGKCEIARRVGLSEKTVRDIVKDVLLEKERPGRQGELLEGEVPVAPEAPEVLRAGTEGAGTPVAPEDGTPDEGPGAPRVESKAFEPTHPHHAAPTAGNLDRSVERVLARFGLIEEATVCFVPGQGLHFVGALLLLPALVDSGFFDAVEAAYGKLKNGFYGLRHTVMTLALMGALRLRRAEHLVHVPPEAIGRLLGLDRAPEVKTLRRRVAELGTLGGADRLMRRIGEDLARSEPEVLAFLYVDGHVRPYSGKRPIAQAYVTQRHLAMPATTDFWLHGADGQPLLVVTGEVVPALTKALLPILEAVRRVIGPGRRATIVFDRGGWSPKLFRKIVALGFDFLTYRKGKRPRYPESDFSVQTLKLDGQEVSYRLRDGSCRLGRQPGYRCIAILRTDGRQTQVVTNRRELSAPEVAYRMFARWRQENFFKYAAEEFALDALDTYATEPEDPTRTVPNPARRELDRKLRQLREEEQALLARLGSAADQNDEQVRPTLRGFKLAHAPLRDAVHALQTRRTRLQEQRAQLPDRVPVAETRPHGQVPEKLEVERKHLMNIIKLAVYRAETALFTRLHPAYSRTADEGRALLREAFHASGSLELTEGFLQVGLAPLSAPRRTEALRALCAHLNQKPVRIPGTSLRLKFTIGGPECLN